MKKIFNIITLAAFGALTLQSCDPMKDTYADLDKSGVDNSLVVELEYKMVEADYTSLASISGNTAKNKSFISEDSAKVLIPEILKTKFRYEDETSVVNVTYEVGNLTATVKAPVLYTVTDAVYETVTGDTRFKNFDSEAKLIDGINIMHPNPSQFDLVRITYTWYDGVSNASKTTDAVYLNGEWSLGAYKLEPVDYTNMEQANAYFARYASAAIYLPNFLKIKFPYKATEGMIQVIYYEDYNSRGNIQRMMALEYENGVWVARKGSVISSSSKFVIKDGVWVADNTIKYTLVTNDYKVTIAELVKDELPKAWTSMTKYGNFDMRDWNVAQIEKYLALFADGKYPNAEIGQVCQITYVTYSPSGTLVKSFVKNANGKFEVQ